MRTIQLKTSDNLMIEISEAAVMQCEVLKNCLEDDSSNSSEIVIPVPNVRAETMRKVIQWIVRRQAADLTEEEEGGFRDWEKRFVDVDLNDMYELIMAANYLSMNALLHRCCQKVADMITGKTPEEIREIFGIENDFSAEEEAELRNQNAWVFERNAKPESNTASTSASNTNQ